MAVRPSKITFQVDGYQITGDPGCSITASGAFASQLPIYVEQTGANPEIEATISAPIKDFGGGSTTNLRVLASTGSDHTGLLKLDGINTYTGGTDVAGGMLEAETWRSLPNDAATDPTYYDIDVTDAGTLIVGTKEVSGVASWTSAQVSRLLNNSTTTFAPDSNFGMSPDKGTAFEFSGNIPAGDENFVKLDTGTLTLSGVNEYEGMTTVKKGTLVATKPAALPGYNDTVNPHKITVKDNGTTNFGYGNYDGDDVAGAYDGTKDPCSTLVVRSDTTSSDGWANAEINKLLYGTVNEPVANWTANPWSAKFDSNTNFGVEVPEGAEFSLEPAAGHFFSLGNVTDREVPNPGTAYNRVGFVKLGGGTLIFGNGLFAGPMCIYEGTLKAAEGRFALAC
jgi:autotransporter-associated beta strand protein